VAPRPTRTAPSIGAKNAPPVVVLREPDRTSLR
jgi:hypothetical protein